MSRSPAPVRSCPSCLGPLVQIDLGSQMTLRSCSRCDSRFWSVQGESTDLGSVLATVAEDDKRRKPSRSAR